MEIANYKFHWKLAPADDPPDLDSLTGSLLCAEELGIESVLLRIELPTSYLNTHSTWIDQIGKIRIMAECIPFSVSADVFTEQIRALSARLRGRLLLCFPIDQWWRQAGNRDETMDDDAYRRLHDYLAACSSLRGPRPEIFLEGKSAEAATLAIKFADCLWLHSRNSKQFYSDALPLLHMGKEAGICMSLIARETSEEAYAAASPILPGCYDARDKLLDPACCLWTNPAFEGVTLIGSFDEVAEALVRLSKYGISQFLLHGDRSELMGFGLNVLPLVRAKEAGNQVILKQPIYPI